MQERDALRMATSAAESARTALRRVAARTLVVLALVSCSEPGTSPPLEQKPPAAPLPSQPVPETPAFPALTKPGEIYLSVEGPSEANGNFTSRYVLYADKTFALQYVGPGVSLSYPGRYVLAGSVIMFNWDEINPLGNWSASGTLSGSDLAVQYNIYMLLSDFVDARYVRVTGT